jgi:hypothetical protein
MAVLRTILLIITAATASSLAAMQPEQIRTNPLPPNHKVGLDMELSEAEVMPAEPELAGELVDFQEESWSGSPVDLLRPIHHLYTDLRRQLVRYQMTWSGLPQVRIPAGDGALGRDPADPRLIILRERLGLPHQGGLDEALRAKVASYQQAHGLKSDGIPGADTLKSLNRGAAYYERRILLNLERARRLPSVGAAGKYILVDAGSSRLWMYENGRPVDSMRVIVGAPATETPMMAGLIRYAAVNPYWNVPPELVQSLIAPRVLSEGYGYLTARGYEVLESWREDAGVVSPDTVDWRAVANGDLEIRVRQLPGPGNSMGDIKFMMPNEHGIYLHDTPNKALFAQDHRWVSNGCVRVEDARRLARWMFGEWPTPQDKSRETRVDLETPLPVYITYLTTTPETEGVAFRSDPYQRDGALLARFDGLGDGMTDMPAATLATALREAATAAQDRGAGTPAMGTGAVRTAATPAPVRIAAPAPVRVAARTTSTPASRQIAARTAATPAPGRGAAQTTTTPSSGQRASRSAATPAPARAAARAPSSPAPRQSALRSAATSAPRKPATSATTASASRQGAARTTAAPAPARGSGRTAGTPAPGRTVSRTAAAPANRQGAVPTTAKPTAVQRAAGTAGAPAPARSAAPRTAATRARGQGGARAAATPAPR